MTVARTCSSTTPASTATASAPSRRARRSATRRRTAPRARTPSTSRPSKSLHAGARGTRVPRALSRLKGAVEEADDALLVLGRAGLDPLHVLGLGDLPQRRRAALRVHAVELLAVGRVRRRDQQ